MKNIKGILFDAAGTLIKLTEPVGDIYARWAEEGGVRARPEDLERAFPRAMATLTARRLAESADQDGEAADLHWWREVVRLSFMLAGGQDIPEERFSSLFWSFAEWGVWALYEDVPETIIALKQSRFKVGVVSNFDARLERILVKLALKDMLDGLVYSSRVGREKPHPLIFREGARALGLAPAEVLHVGDSYAEDYLGAKGAGLEALLLDRRGRFTIKERIGDLKVLPVMVPPKKAE